MSRTPERRMRHFALSARLIGRLFLGLLYLAASVFHLVNPEPFVSVLPNWVPWGEEVVLLTGLAEGAGALALLQPWSGFLRRAGAIGLALYAVCVYPANIQHMALDLARPDQGLGLVYHVPRLMAQPLLVWLALWSGGVIDWPLRGRPGVSQSRGLTKRS